MPIRIDEFDAQVELQETDALPQVPREPSPAEALARWQALSRRAQELAARTAARDLDD